MMKSPRPHVAADKQWLSPAEIAALKLSGFVIGEWTIRQMLRGGAFAGYVRPRQGTRGQEIHWQALPAAAQADLIERFPGAAGSETDAPPETPAARAARHDLVAEAKLCVARAAGRFAADFRGTKKDAMAAFCKTYNRRQIDVSAAVYATVDAVTARLVRRWMDAANREDAFAQIKDKRGRPAGTGLFDTDERLRAYVVAQVAARPHLSATLLNSAISVDLGRTVSLRTLQAFLKTWRAANAPVVKALTDPDRYRSHCKPAFGRRSQDVTRINQRWELDGTKADAMCVLPDGSVRRYTISAVIDVFTRRAMTVVSDNPRAAATMALFRRAIIAWGLPETIKTDNGKDFVAAATRRFCADLGIEIVYSKPFTPEEKPHIERFFGTLNRGLFPLLPGYVGHNVAERKAIENRASFSHRFGTEARLVIETTLTPEGLQARLDAWLRDVYEYQVHGGLNATPRAVADAHANEARFIEDVRILDALMLDAPDAGGIRVVGKKGIRILGRLYIAPELGAGVGYRVHVRMDPFDPGRIVVYNADRTAFICVAEDPDLTGADRREIAYKAQGVQRKHLRLVRQGVSEIQKTYPSAGLADRILTAESGDAFVASADAKSAMTYAAPRLIAQRDGLTALETSKMPPRPIEPTAEERSAHADYIAELETRTGAPAARTVQCDGYERPAFVGDDFGFYDWATDFIAAGNVLDDRDREIFDALKTDRIFAQMRKNRRG